MLILKGANELIQLVTATGTDIEVSRSAMDASDAAPPVIQIVPDLGPMASITTATTTTIVAAPGSSTVRNVKHISIYNNHTSTTETVTVQGYDGTNTINHAKATLLAGECLVFDENGTWTHYDTNMAAYPSVGNVATQAEQEAGTATDKYVPPGRQQYHKSATKGWGNFTVAGATTAGYNVDTPTDNGTGDITVNWTTDFSAANAYECQVTVEMTATTYAVANARTAHIRSGGLAAGTTRCDCIDGTTITQLVKDPSSWHMAAHGDL